MIPKSIVWDDFSHGGLYIFKHAVVGFKNIFYRIKTLMYLPSWWITLYISEVQVTIFHSLEIFKFVLQVLFPLHVFLASLH